LRPLEDITREIKTLEEDTVKLMEEIFET